ncbi:hypothetical protein, partial [Actinotalea sp.]|uniref:hypothetical protein n=1 Tax=Actinotalea sp. TaxID=1872145 RepID=UPI002C1FEE11
MLPGLGLRSRILVLTMPLVLLGHAFGAGIVYLSLGQVLEAAARRSASSEVAEVRADLALHESGEDVAYHVAAGPDRVVQIVEPSGTLVATSMPALGTPIHDPAESTEEVRVVIDDDVPGLGGRTYAIGMSDATTIGGQRRVVLVAVPTDLGASALGPTVTFGVLGLIGIILIL